MLLQPWNDSFSCNQVIKVNEFLKDYFSANAFGLLIKLPACQIKRTIRMSIQESR